MSICAGVTLSAPIGGRARRAQPATYTTIDCGARIQDGSAPHRLTAEEHGEDTELDQYGIDQQHQHVRMLQAVAWLHECHNDPRVIGHEEKNPHKKEREQPQRVVLGVMSRIGQRAHASEPFGHECNKLISLILAVRERKTSDDHQNHQPHAQVNGPGEAEETGPQLVEFGERHGHLRELHLAEEVRTREVEVVHDREHGEAVQSEGLIVRTASVLWLQIFWVRLWVRARDAHCVQLQTSDLPSIPTSTHPLPLKCEPFQNEQRSRRPQLEP